MHLDFLSYIHCAWVFWFMAVHWNLSLWKCCWVPLRLSRSLLWHFWSRQDIYSTDFPCWINIREYWVASATFGGVIGSLLPINTEGISFVMTAMFVVIFMDQWLKEKNHTSSLLGLGISFLCLLVFGPDSFMIPTMILIIVSLTLLRKKLDIPDQKNYSRHHFDKCASEKMK